VTRDPGGKADEDDLSAMLGSLAPGFLPRPVFDAVARLVVLPTFVVIPLLPRDGRIMVLLHRRDPSDPNYASFLHPAGTVLRSTDENLATAYRRLLDTELPGVRIAKGPIFVEPWFERIARGQELALIHWIELDAKSQGDGLFDAEALPTDLVPTDYRRISRAVDHYRAFTANR